MNYGVLKLLEQAAGEPTSDGRIAPSNPLATLFCLLMLLSFSYEAVEDYFYVAKLCCLTPSFDGR